MPGTDSDPDVDTDQPREPGDDSQAGSAGNPRSAFRFEDSAEPGTSAGQKARARNRATDKLVRQSGKQFRMVQAKSAEKVRQFAEAGKGRVDEKLDTLIDLISSGAEAIDERYGPELGRYAQQAADLASSVGGNIRSKSVDDLIEDSRAFVRRNPLVAVAGATLAGFVMTRIIRAGIDEGDSMSVPVAINGSTTYEGANL